MSLLEKHEADLLEHLRREAFEVKDCFTQHAFQALAGSTLVLGLILELQRENSLVGLAAVLVIIFCLSVARAGIHKFETANRIFGFDLYVHRRARLRPRQGGWQTAMKNIGWEEAFYAWRVIQPRIFNEIYRKSAYWFVVTKPKRPNRPAMRWVTAGASGERHGEGPGRYLKVTISILHIVAGLAIVPLVYMAIQVWLDRAAYTFRVFDLQVDGRYPGLAFWLVPLTMAGTVWLRVLRVNKKREALERGLLSINACAVVWHAVVIAHFRALEAIGADRTNGWAVARYEHYTDKLRDEADALVARLDDIYDWMDG